MKKQLLHVDYDYDFLLIGICSHVKDYRLCWEINKALDIKLERENDITFNLHAGHADTTSSELSAHSLYFYDDEENNNYFHIISNKTSKETLITEQKQVDYFLRIKGNNNPGYSEDLIKKLRSIKIILTAYEIDPNKLKSKQKLLL